MGDCNDDDDSLLNVPCLGGGAGGLRSRRDRDDDDSLLKVACLGGGAGGLRPSGDDDDDASLLNVLCRGGGAGGFRLSGIQSGSVSVVNGFEERWPFGMKPSGGLIVAFTGTPISSSYQYKYLQYLCSRFIRKRKRGTIILRKTLRLSDLPLSNHHLLRSELAGGKPGAIGPCDRFSSSSKSKRLIESDRASRCFCP